MHGEVERLRDLLAGSPAGFWTVWDDAGEDLAGQAYRAFQLQYANVVEAGEAIWGPPVFKGKASQLPDDYPHEIRHRLTQARAHEVALWKSADMYASVILGSHDADTMRTIQVEYRRQADQ
jgi:hypothetical protein